MAQVVLIASSVAKVVVGYSSQVVREPFFKFVIVLVFCITTHILHRPLHYTLVYF